MSRFFNETRKPGSAQNGAPTVAPVDVEEAVETLKRGIPAGAAEQASAASFEPLFSALNQSSEIASRVTAVRLESCRKIHLPRNNEKSFLAAQYNPGMQLAVEAYRSLRTRLVKRQTEKGTRSLVISSAEQGEGKTLTSLNLALCYANIQNWPVLLIDTDLRTRGLSRLLGDPESPGLAKILESGNPYQSAILATNSPNLYFLPAGTANTSPPELFSQDRWKEFVGWCAESFRLVIIDAPPVLGLADFELISAPCESVLLVVRARKSERDALAKMRHQLDAKKLVGVVLNFASDPQNKKYYRYGYGYGYGQKEAAEQEQA
jgi:capsular exopolysaccharide synthesis family protein